MSSSVISDNWSLQDISDLLTNGIDAGNTHYLKINRDSDSYGFDEISAAFVKFEAFFDFITDLILRDQIIVDEKYAQAWKSSNNSLQEIEKAGLIRTFPFSNDYEKLVDPREDLVSRMCVTPDLIKDQEANKTSLELSKPLPHSYLSQILWGGAGMLARSFVYERNYTPYPIRKRFFQDSGILLTAEDSVVQFKNIIKEKRASLVAKIRNNDELYSLAVNMPPLPILTIREANSVQDILKIALQIRDEYQELRDWLGCYQQALTKGSISDINRFQKIIRSISLYVDSRSGTIDSNSPTFSASIGTLKIAMKGQPVNAILNQFGIRSTINKLMLDRTGNQELKKLLSFFGHKNSSTGMTILEHFSK